MKFKIINGTKVVLDTLNWQTYKTGERFRISGIRMNLQKAPIYCKKTKEYKHYWLYDVIFEDGKQKTFETFDN